MNKRFISIGPILAGLAASHLLACLQVYISNTKLHQKLTAIEGAGYLLTPNHLVMPMLEGVRSAFFGGLFFTLTVGALITIITLGSAWVWINLFKKNRILLAPFFILWIGCLIETNYKGFCPLPSAYFILVPLVVLFTARRWMETGPKNRSRLNAAILLSPILLLSILWSTLPEGDLFINIRDYLLLSNPVGIKINDFYYKYTMYPAEVFKPLRQKTLKTCSIANISEESGLRLLEDRLLKHDYLVLSTDNVDLRIERQGHRLIFSNHGKEILRTSQMDFISAPDQSLKRFSEGADRYGFFRGFSYLSILTGLPIILYLLLHAGLQYMLCFIKDQTRAFTIASGISLLIGIALFIPTNEDITKDVDIAGAIQSGRWQDNVTALREIEKKKLEITGYQGYQRLKDSAHIPVRYWFARAIGISRGQATRNDLFSLLNDPHPNVVCQALEALSKTGDRSAIDVILQRTGESSHWYVQSYAYRAIRDLGWKQTRSH